jgi:hypothetical protein
MNYQKIVCWGDSQTFGARSYGCYPIFAGRRGEFCQPLWCGKDGGKETGNAEVDVQAFPVQAAASAQDLNRTQIAPRRPPQVRYQFHSQSDRYPVRKLDPQCVLPRTVHDEPGPCLRFRRTLPGAGRSNKLECSSFCIHRGIVRDSAI